MVVIDLSTAFDNLCYLKTTKPRYLQQSYSLVRNLSHKQTTCPLVLQLHCQNQSLLHTAYLKAQFSANTFQPVYE